MSTKREDPKERPIEEEAEREGEGGERARDGAMQEAREKDSAADREDKDDEIKDRNHKQVDAMLRTFDNVDDKDDNRPHGRYTSTQAEQLLVDAPSGTWLLRLDPGLKRMMLTIKDGEGHVSHYATDADNTDATILRYRVRKELRLSHQARTVRGDEAPTREG